jgi:hypothetical protein
VHHEDLEVFRQPAREARAQLVGTEAAVPGDVKRLEPAARERRAMPTWRLSRLRCSCVIDRRRSP